MESAILTGSVSLLSSNSSTCEALSARRSTVSRPVLLSSAVSTVSTVSAAGALSLLLRMETETRRLRWVDDDVTHFKQASAGVDEARRLARAGALILWLDCREGRDGMLGLATNQERRFSKSGKLDMSSST
mmetsp:Transcript_9681/g.26305  ORF Transcript_9681/g.26305 Transcript_9681/m.26305 type:complete len:131 (-) Transcript_9681:56-448(-)